MPDNPFKGIDLDVLRRIPMTELERDRLRAVWRDETIRPVLEKVYTYIEELVLETLLICDKDAIEVSRGQLMIVKLFFEIIGRSVKTETELEDYARTINPGLVKTI